jgi:hypothetical protein
MKMKKKKKKKKKKGKVKGKMKMKKKKKKKKEEGKGGGKIQGYRVLNGHKFSLKPVEKHFLKTRRAMHGDKSPFFQIIIILIFSILFVKEFF